MRQAVFIERDGVLNRVRVERQHQVSPVSAAEFQIIKETGLLLGRLKAAGLKVIVTTNQPGLSCGQLSRRELDRMHDMLRSTLPIDDIFVCPHDAQDDCPCRKPKPGLMQEARFKWQLDLDRSFVVSDKWLDADAARACGCTSLLMHSPWVGSVHHDFLLPDLATVVERILALHASHPVLTS